MQDNFNINPKKIFWGRNLQVDSKYTKEYKGPRVDETIWKIHKVGALLLSDFKNYYKAIVIKTFLFWHKDRCIK